MCVFTVWLPSASPTHGAVRQRSSARWGWALRSTRLHGTSREACSGPNCVRLTTSAGATAWPIGSLRCIALRWTKRRADCAVGRHRGDPNDKVGLTGFGPNINIARVRVPLPPRPSGSAVVWGYLRITTRIRGSVASRSCRRRTRTTRARTPRTWSRACKSATRKAGRRCSRTSSTTLREYPSALRLNTPADRALGTGCEYPPCNGLDGVGAKCEWL